MSVTQAIRGSRRDLLSVSVPHRSSGVARNWFRVPGLEREIRIKIATDRSDLEQAYTLLAENYRARGYDAPSDRPLRYTPYHALPGTATLVATDADGRVLATLTLVPDSPLLGLPLETIYGPEVEGLRRAGLRPAEAISLADTGLGTREFLPVFKALIRLAMQYHARRGGDCWVIAVNPRHRAFYRKVLGFAPLGPRRSYPAVQDHPAEAYVLTEPAMADAVPAMHREVFGDPLPEAVLTPARWSREQVRHFGARSSQLDASGLDELLGALDATH